MCFVISKNGDNLGINRSSTCPGFFSSCDFIFDSENLQGTVDSLVVL